MTDLERAKKQLEYRKVETARVEMEVRIMERNAEIERLKENIEVQNGRLEEITNELKE